MGRAVLRVLLPLPKTFYVAVSGGVDSMAALNFLSRSHDVVAAYFDHGTGHDLLSYNFVRDYCKKIDVPFVDGAITTPKSPDMSKEEYWRIERYKFFSYLSNDSSVKAPVITAHHLGDAVETWVWSCMHGNPTLPAIQRDNIYRPFLSTPKQELIDWAVRHEVPWVEDPSNVDQSHIRNYTRHTAIPVLEVINSGLSKVVKKKVEEIANTIRGPRAGSYV